MRLTSILFLAILVTTAFAQQRFEVVNNEMKSYQQSLTNKDKNILFETGYNPEYYRLEFNSDPSQENFSGTTTMHFTTTEALNTIKLSAKDNLSITGVTYHGQNISNYTQANNLLSITLPNNLPINRLDSIAVSFSGNASSSRAYSIGSHNGTPVSYTLAEPFHSSTWWVCKDDLESKAKKVDIYITHPSQYKAGSNGTLMSVTSIGNGNSITHWRHEYPITTYLVAVGVSNYTEYNNAVTINGTNVPIINYVYPESLTQEVKNRLDEVPYYITFLSEKFGDYPYKNEKYGHLEWEKGGGMEHATMSFIGSYSEDLVVHELGHQWFGDQVTCNTWSDIWLNEGFAEYTTGLVIEDKYGESTFTNWKGDNINYITTDPSGSVYNYEPENESRIFNFRLTYVKGSMIAHLLRYKLGDDLYFPAITNYLNDSQFNYGYATTDEFKNNLEAFTNVALDEFFNDWVYGEGYPIFDINVNNLPNNVSVTVNQTSSHNSVDFFETPFEIEFNGANGQTTIRRLYLTQNGEVFTITDIPFSITSYTFNPKNDIVCQINSTTLDAIDILEKPENINLYPNPAKEKVIISTTNNIEQVIVYNTAGQLIYNENGVKKNQININTKNWKSGVYFIEITTNNNKQVKKLIIK